MGKHADITGRRFGRLVVESFAYVDAGRHSMWYCKCDCGKITVVQASSLRSGHTNSCGCLHAEKAKRMCLSHGGRKTRLYSVWRGMIGRTEHESHYGYDYYGERGITMCDEWRHDFQSFHDWAVTHGYREDLTIDRIDVNGNYCPENCRWVTMKEQQRNRRNNARITYNGETLPLSEWCERLGIKIQTVWDRINKLGWSVKEAFETPVNGRR